MFSTSLDILYLVLTVCIAVLTFFLCWALYYFIANFRRFDRISKKIESGVVKAEELITIAKSKLRDSSAYFMILGEIAKKAMEFVQEKRAKSQTKKSSRKK